MRSNSALLGALLTLLCSTSTWRAAGQSGGLELAWDAPVECPSGSAAEKATGALVGPMAAPYEAEIRLYREGEAWVGALRTPGAVRELRAATCREAAQALVVILALAINPNAAVSSDSFLEDEPRARSSAVPTDGPEPRDPARGPVVVRPALERRAPPATEGASQRRAPRFAGTLRFFGNVGVLPAPTMGASLGLRYGNGTAAAELAVLAALPRTGAHPTERNRGGTFDWEAARLSGEREVPGLPCCVLIAGVDLVS